METNTFDCVKKALEKLEENNVQSPKWLMYPRSFIDQMGVEEALQSLYELFGIRMKVKYKDETQYVFEEVINLD